MSAIAPIKDVGFISITQAEDSTTSAKMTRFLIQFKTKEIFESFEREAFPEQWGKYVKYYHHADPSNMHLDLYTVSDRSQDLDDFCKNLSELFPSANQKEIERFVLKVDTSKLKTY